MRAVDLFSVLCVIGILICTGCVSTQTDTNSMTEGAITTTTVDTDKGGASPSISICTQPVSAKELIPFLPVSPSGWQETEIIEQEDGSFSDVSQGYVSGTSAGVNVGVRIIDTCNRTLVQELINGRKESSDEFGYYHNIQVEGYPGVESYWQPETMYSCNVLVAERYWVIVQTHGTMNKDILYQFVDAIDYKSLAEL